VLVSAADSKTRYIIYHGYRHQIDNADMVTVGLAVGTVPVVTVSPAFIDALPKGDPIAPTAVADLGKPSDAVPGRSDLKAGQLLSMETLSGSAQHYLVERHQLTPIPELAYDIQLAYPSTAKAYGADPFGLAVSPAMLAAAKIGSPKQVTDASPPSERPAFVPSTGMTTVCLSFRSDSFVPAVTVSPTLPALDTQIATAGRTSEGIPLADYLYVPPGRVAVVEVMSSQTAPAGTLALVTDLGTSYPLAAPDVLGWLGYSAVKPIRVPAGLMARVPQGPGLSHDAAMQRA
jgi:hypothetical protein